MKTKMLDKAKQVLIESGHVLETPPRGQPEELYEAVVIPHGGVYGRRDSLPDEVEYSSLHAGQTPNPAHPGAIFSANCTAAILHQQSPAMAESPYGDADGGAYFDGSATSARRSSRRQSTSTLSHAIESGSQLRGGSGMEEGENADLRDEDQAGEDDVFGGMDGLFEEEYRC
jgi:hypothetical protein